MTSTAPENIKVLMGHLEQCQRPKAMSQLFQTIAVNVCYLKLWSATWVLYRIFFLNCSKIHITKFTFLTILK